MAFGLIAGVGLLAYGAIVQEEGRKKSLRDQAAVEDANALFFAEQQEFVEISGRREIGIFDDQAESFIGDKISMIAQAGVDLSGNLLSVLANESQKIASEHNAILLQNEFKSRLAEQRVINAQETARRLRESADDNSSFFGSLLGIGGQVTLAQASSSGGRPDGGLGQKAAAPSPTIGSHFGPRITDGSF